MLEGRVKLVRERVARSAAPIAARAATLNHEVWNHSVKIQAVVIVFLLLLPSHFVGKLFCSLGQTDEIGHGLGRFLLKQANDNIALRSLEYRVCSSGSTHAFSSRAIVHERPQTAPLPIPSHPLASLISYDMQSGQYARNRNS